MSLDYILSLQIAVKAHLWFLISNIFFNLSFFICLLPNLYTLNTFFTFFSKENNFCLFCILWCKRRIVIHQASLERLHIIAEFLLTSCGKLLKVFIYIKTRHRWNCFLDNPMYRFIIGLYPMKLCTLLVHWCVPHFLGIWFVFCLFLFPCDYIIAQFLSYYKWYLVQS